MTREIKIKIWDKEKKTMSIGMSLPMLAGYIMSIYPKLGNEEYIESTGLADKNGKEIYEGDIVKDGLGEIGEVTFEKYCTNNEESEDILGWCFSYPKAGRKALDPQSLFEVIGNIYENKRLLK